MMKILFAVINMVLFLTFNAAYASDFGSVSDTIVDLLGNVSQIMNVISWVAGAGFGISAIMKYQEHRQRPQSVPLSGPIIEIIIAVILIAFPFILEATTQMQPELTIGNLQDSLNIG